MTSYFVRDQASLLRDGVDGAQVVENLRSHYGTDCSFEKSISWTRAEFLNSGIRHSNFAEDLRRVEESMPELPECTRFVEQLRGGDMKTQYDLLKEARGSTFPHDFKVQLLKIRLLPDNVARLKLSEDEGRNCQKMQKNRRISKNAALVHIGDGYAFHRQHSKMLESPQDLSVVRLCLCLAFVSGRRETEILNGRSEFTPVDGTPFHVRFKGQLKKNQSAKDAPLIIPLLVESSVFIAGLKTLRSKQSQDTPLLTNKQIAARYTSQLHGAQKRLYPGLNKTHDLRGLYVQYVNTMFGHGVALPLLCMLCLGHSDISDSLHYMSYSVAGMEAMRGVCGNLQVEAWPQYIDNVK